jgi:hypothetical protein
VGSDNIDGTAEQTKNTVRRISLSEEDLAFGEVPASHCDPVNREQTGGPRRRCQIIARILRALPSSCVLSGRSGRSLAINRFYAAEELVAELCAAFLCAEAVFEDKVTAFQTGEVCARKEGRVVLYQV